MGASFKTKALALFLMLSVSFFVPTPVAHADAVVDFVSGAATFLINAIVDTLSFAITVAAPVLAVGAVYLGGPLGFVTVGVTAWILCSNIDVFCPDGSSGVLLATVSATSTGCENQIPVTFYNPQMNVNYALLSTPYYTKCVYTDEDQTTTRCDDVFVADDERYADASCGSSSPSGMYALLPDEGGCVSLSTFRTNPSCRLDTNFNETDRQVAIYRFTLPADSSQQELNEWFVNKIQYNGGIGSGFLDMTHAESYLTAVDTGPLATIPYSQMCSGNVCHFVDTTAPDNSYVAYAMKILGSYTPQYEKVSYCASGDCEADSDFRTYDGQTCDFSGLNKFFNNDGASTVSFPYTSLGNAIVGPFKTGTPICPLPVTLAVTKAGTGSGVVTSAPAGINCSVNGSTCSMQLDKGTVVALTAIADSSSVFTGWSVEGDPAGCAGGYTGTCTITMGDVNRTVTATFVPRALEVNFSGTDLVSERYKPWFSGWKTRFRSTLTANVSGTAQGPVSYTFTCDTRSPDIMSPMFTNSPSPSGAPDSKSYDCLYSSNNPVTAKVRVERGGMIVEKTFDLSNKLIVSLSANPASGSAFFTTTITAQVSGTNQGAMDYYFACENNPPYNYYQTRYQDLSTNATQVSHTCWYSSVRTYTPRVTVVRGGTTVYQTTSVAVTAYTPCVNGANNPPACNACTAPLIWNGTACVSPAACVLPWGGTIASGDSVTAYQTSTVFTPSTCTSVSQTRTCTNGSLSGTYTNQNCTVTPPLPTASISISPSIIDSGQSTTLTWSSRNADYCTGYGFTAGALSGNVSVTPPQTQSYQIDCTRGGVTSERAVASVTVLSPDVFINASKTRVQTGDTSVITWGASGVKSCLVSGPSSPPYLASGNADNSHNFSVNSPYTTPPITGQSTFTIVCKTNGGKTLPAESVTVNIVPLFQEF